MLGNCSQGIHIIAFRLEHTFVCLSPVSLCLRGFARRPVRGFARILSVAHMALADAPPQLHKCPAAVPRTCYANLVGGARPLDMRKDDDAILSTPTPYGLVEKTFHMDNISSEASPVLIKYTDPRAATWLLMRSYKPFQNFLVENLRDGVSRVCIYHDEVRPGNVHRPDDARLYMCFYWMLLDLPEWWNTSFFGWWDLTFVTVSAIKQIKGGMA